MNDLISRQAVLDYPIRLDHYDKEHGNRHFVLGIESVMEYVESLPSAGQNCVLCEYYTEIETDDGIKGKCTRRTGSDLISRQDAIDAIPQTSADAFENCRNCKLLDRGQVIDIIESLPSADRPTGEWVRKYDKQINCYWYECNQCGEYRPRNVLGKEWSSPYCPNCGARMYKGGESDG